MKRGWIQMANNSKETDNDLVKVVYFDEDSALEYLDIKNEGRYLFNQENLEKYEKDKSNKNAANVGLVGKTLNLFSFVGLEAGVSTELQSKFSKSNNKLVNSTISNTILTDFLMQVRINEEIIEISGEEFRLSNNSFAYFKAISPLLKLFNKDFLNQNNEIQDIDILAIEEVLDMTKGYFEFLAKKDSEDVVLRLNTTSLRNNYKLGDLQFMNLTFYAVNVGKINQENINIEKFIDNLDSNKKEDKGKQKEEIIQRYSSEIYGEDESEESGAEEETKYLKLYDVILAGVKSDENK